MVNKDKVFFLVRFTVSLGLVAVLLVIMRNNITDITNILKNSNKIFFVAALAISIPTAIGMAFRLKMLMAGQGLDLSIKDFIYLTFIGYFFNNFFPTSIGGDVVKAHYASRKTNNKPGSYAAVITDRIIGFAGVISIAAVGIIFVGREFSSDRVLWIVGSLSLALIIVVSFLMGKRKFTGTPSIAFEKKPILKKAIDKLSKLYSAINAYRHKGALLFKTYLLALFMQAAAVFSIYFFILSVGGDIDILRLLLIIPLVWAVSMLPSLNGLGVREGAFVYFLKADIGVDRAFSVSFLWLGVMVLYSLIGGILHLVYPFKIKVEEKSEGET